MASLGLEEMLSILSKDRVLKKVIHSEAPPVIKLSDDPYFSLLKAIVSQQLSTKAAATIWTRFLTLFEAHYPTAEVLVEMPVEILRGAGLSGQKSGYLKNIASFHLSHSISFEALVSLPDEAVIDYLTQIKGVGRWTVEMLLMFSLGRMDVFPIDDFGIKSKMIRLYTIQSSVPAEIKKELTRIAEKWKPCRSLACHYLWRLPN
jgi:DNA-3-methyladenine glycosylase II